MKKIIITCDVCNNEIKDKSYYETRVDVTIEIKSNSDAEHQKSKNKKISLNFCSECFNISEYNKLKE